MSAVNEMVMQGPTVREKPVEEGTITLSVETWAGKEGHGRWRSRQTVVTFAEYDSLSHPGLRMMELVRSLRQDIKELT